MHSAALVSLSSCNRLWYSAGGRLRMMIRTLPCILSVVNPHPASLQAFILPIAYWSGILKHFAVWYACALDKSFSYNNTVEIASHLHFSDSHTIIHVGLSFPAFRQNPSYDVHLEVKREDYQNCSEWCNASQLCKVLYRHENSSDSDSWLFMLKVSPLKGLWTLYNIWAMMSPQKWLTIGDWFCEAFFK